MLLDYLYSFKRQIWSYPLLITIHWHGLSRQITSLRNDYLRFAITQRRKVGNSANGDKSYHSPHWENTQGANRRGPATKARSSPHSKRCCHFHFLALEQLLSTSSCLLPYFFHFSRSFKGSLSLVWHCTFSSRVCPFSYTDEYEKQRDKVEHTCGRQLDPKPEKPPPLTWLLAQPPGIRSHPVAWEKQHDKSHGVALQGFHVHMRPTCF